MCSPKEGIDAILADEQLWSNGRKILQIVKKQIEQLQAEVEKLKAELDKWNLSAKNIEEDLTFEAENKRLKNFLNVWDGHDSDCGSNSEGFEGCDETMFNCNCGYEEAKKQALTPEKD